MKSKMKTTFAIIAVALMVLVAVVPMVSVYTDAADPTTVVEPEIDGKITVTGKVLTSTGGAATIGTNKVIVSYGTTYFIEAKLNGNVYTADLQETSISSVTIGYYDKDDELVDGYDTVTLTGLVTGSYTANLVEEAADGMSEATLTIKDQGNINLAVYGNKYSGTFYIYESDAASALPIYTGEIAKDGTAKVRYKDATKVYITISNLTLDGMENQALNVNEKTKLTITNTSTSANTNEYVVPITLDVSNTGVPGYNNVPITVKSVVFTPTDTTVSPVTLKYLVNKFDSAKSAYFTMTTLPTTAGAYSVGVAYSTETAQELTGLSYQTSQVKVAPKLIYGTVSMATGEGSGTTHIESAGELTLTYGENNTEITVSADKDGKFARLAVKSGNEFVTSYTAKNFKVGNNNFATTSAVTANSAAAVALTTTDFLFVQGLMYFGSAEANSVKEKNLSVSGGITFGTLATKATGVFEFMAEKNKTLTIKGVDPSGSSVTYSGDTTVNVVGTASKGLKIAMSDQEISVKVQDALGKDIPKASITGFVLVGYDEEGEEVPVTTGALTVDDGVAKTNIRGDLTATSYDVKLTVTNYTYENEQYAKDAAYKAEQASYKVAFYGNGATSPLADVTTAQAWLSWVYVNTVGSVVYDPISSINLGQATSGVYTVTLESKYLSVTPTTVLQEAVVIYGLDGYANAIFDKSYIASSDAKGNIKVFAANDSIEGKVVRQDGTGIPGVKVLVKGENVINTVYTNEKGEFKAFAYKAKIGKDSQLVLTDPLGKYAESTVDVYKDDVKKTNFTFDKDTYEALFVDADGNDIIPNNYHTAVKYNGTATTAFVYNDVTTKWTNTGAWEVGKKVAIELFDENNKYVRTFADHILTASDVSTGVITFVSNQESYTFTAYDANLDELALVKIQMYKYVNGVPFIMNNVIVDADGVDSILLPYIDTTGDAPGIADAVGTEYGFVAYSLTNTFSEEVTKIIFNESVAISVDATMAFLAVDSLGNTLIDEPGAAAVYKDGEFYVLVEPHDATILGKVYYVYMFDGDPTAKYTFTIVGVFGGYTFDENLAPVKDETGQSNGLLVANETVITGSVLDASGKYIDITNVQNIVTVEAYNENDLATPISSAVVVGSPVAGYYYEMIVDPEEVSIFYMQDIVITEGQQEVCRYTFDASEIPTMVANECYVSPAFLAINGIPASPATVIFTAYMDDGSVVTTGNEAVAVANAKLFLDADEVAYYAVKVVTVTANTDGYFKAGETYISESIVFMSPYSKITGPLPVTANNGDHVTVELWKDGVVVDGADADITDNGMKYVAYVDISGAEDATAGVDFDSITATYYHGTNVYTSFVDPTSSYNPIIITPTLVYDIVLSSSAAELANVSKVIYDNIAYLSADQMFENVIYTDNVSGRQVVEKYTFAGWYVNGVALNSKEANVSVELTQLVNSGYAKYTVETYEVVSPTPEPEPAPVVDNSIDPTVLVIGICAVIVALIAVAYAVISSRSKEKKE